MLLCRASCSTRPRGRPVVVRAGDSQKPGRRGLALCCITPSHRRGFLQAEESVEGKASTVMVTLPLTVERACPHFCVPGSGSAASALGDR